MKRLTIVTMNVIHCHPYEVDAAEHVVETLLPILNLWGDMTFLPKVWVKR